MIAQLIEVLNIAAETLPVDTRYGWAQIIDGRPRVHVGNGQWVEVAQDTNGTWSYVRANGQARVEPVDIGEPCSGVKLRLPLRLVALVDRSACDELPGLLVQTAASIRQARKQFVAASQAVSVTFSSILWQVGGFESQEFQPVPNIPTDKALIAIDILMEVDGREDCFDGCGTLTDVVCAIIQRASNAKVAECLGSERLAELCDTTPIECDPLEWTLKDSEGNTLDTGEVEDPCGETLEVIAPDATVTRDGSPFGTVPSGGTIDVPSCNVIVDFSLNGGRGFASIQPECGENNYDIVVTCPDGTPVGEWNPATDRIEVPCVEECPLEVTFDGLALTTVEDACETGTLALDCNSTLPFARVEDGATRSGNYLPVGDDYVKDVDHKFEYITDRWVLVQPGSDIQAAPGPSSEAPWEADWTGTGITVTQGTISEYCDDCPTCPLEVTINDAEFTTVDDACAAPLLNIRVSSTDNDPVGSLIGGKWVIADSPISVDGTPELNLPAEDALNITINDGTSNVPAVSVDTSTPGELAIEIAPCPPADLCDLLGDVAPEDAQSEILDCVTEATWTAIRIAQICDLDAQAYLARVEAADGDYLEQAVRDAVCDYVVALKTAGLWSSLRMHIPLIGPRTRAGALVPLVGCGPIQSFNFVNADYNRKTGLIGDASTKYLDLGRLNSADGQNDQHMGAYVTAIATGTDARFIMGAGVSDAGATNIVRQAAPNTAFYATRNRNSTANILTGNALVTGLVLMNRSGSANYVMRTNGTDNTVTQASQAPIALNVFGFASNQAGTPVTFTDARIAMFSIGASLTPSAIDTAFTNFYNALQTAIP